jgi:hypothetical protein
MSDDDTERYLVQMVPHAPEAPTATQSVTDEVVQRHSVKIVDAARADLNIGAAQAGIDAIKGQTVTIHLNDGPGMFERFTDRARRVTVLAQEEARTLNHSHIGTEHFLLGLLHEGDGVAARALVASGINLEECRKQVEALVATGGRAPSGHIPFTPRGKKVMELALREALQFGHNYIGTEHLLLGLIREAEGVGAQVLKAMGCELNAVRLRVLEILGASPCETVPPVTPQVVRSGPQAVRAPSMEATVLKGLRVYVDALDAQLRAAGF